MRQAYTVDVAEHYKGSDHDRITIKDGATQEQYDQWEGAITHPYVVDITHNDDGEYNIIAEVPHSDYDYSHIVYELFSIVDNAMKEKQLDNIPGDYTSTASLLDVFRDGHLVSGCRVHVEDGSLKNMAGSITKRLNERYGSHGDFTIRHVHRDGTAVKIDIAGSETIKGEHRNIAITVKAEEK